MLLFDSYTFENFENFFSKLTNIARFFSKTNDFDYQKLPYMIISSYTIIFQLKIGQPTCLFHTAQLFDSEE